jgi:hypothetical protein
MLTHNQKTGKIVALPQPHPDEKRFQQERMRDVLLLIENLALQEEATIKLIIDCLYDVGIINIINKKIPNPSLNKFAKLLAGTPKPLAKIIAWRWVKKNAPEKITNWLYRKINF